MLAADCDICVTRLTDQVMIIGHEPPTVTEGKPTRWTRLAYLCQGGVRLHHPRVDSQHPSPLASLHLKYDDSSRLVYRNLVRRGRFGWKRSLTLIAP